GNSLRVKLENTMGEAPIAFSGAYIGVAGEGAAVREKSITRLTFAGKPGLLLAPGQGAYSDPVPFKVNAFQKLSLSLDVQSAADISTHPCRSENEWVGGWRARIGCLRSRLRAAPRDPGSQHWPVAFLLGRSIGRAVF